MVDFGVEIPLFSLNMYYISAFFLEIVKKIYEALIAFTNKAEKEKLLKKTKRFFFENPLI
jgi:hypothetical protein